MEGIFDVGLGISLAICTFVVLVHHQEVADAMYDWYNKKTDPKWLPIWLPWQFRPSHRQSLVLTYTLAAGGAAISFYAFVAAFVLLF